MNWKERYCKAHEEDFKKKYPSAYLSGHYFNPALPKYKTANGLTTFVCNFMKWTGHHAERTNNMGRPIKKYFEKFNIMSGKLEKIENGIEWQKGTGIKGSSDIKGHFLNKNFQFSIPIYIEIKVGKDRMSEDQKKYERLISDSGALYQIVKTPEDFFLFYDYLLNLKN
jgi:hypothetical protein